MENNDFHNSINDAMVKLKYMMRIENLDTQANSPTPKVRGILKTPEPNRRKHK